MAAARAAPGAGRPLWGAAAFAASVCLMMYILQNSSPHSAALFLSEQRLYPDNWGVGSRQAEGQVRRAAATTATCPDPKEVQSSAWAQSCYLVSKVCVDRGMLVLYGEGYQPDANGTNSPNSTKPTLPEFKAENNYGQYIYFYKNGYGEYMYPMDTIRSRAASMHEGTNYLRQPAFSSCTVPVVWYPFWMTNFGHFLRDNAAKLFGFIEDTPWAEHIKLVEMTAEGLAMPGFNQAMLQAMSPLAVETWAEFSTRLLPGTTVLNQPGPPPSVEGDHQRCFESLFVCTKGLNITRWPLHGFGRHMVRSYQHRLPLEARELVGRHSSVVAQQPQISGNLREDSSSVEVGDGRGETSDSSDDSSGGSSIGIGDIVADGSSEATELNIIFQKRPGDTRQLLNLAELLKQCNAWQYRTAAGRQIRAKCREFEITDLVSGMTAAQLADVFVGMHGANLANGWMMRPGSSMIEVQPYGFDAHVPHLQDPLFNAEDADSQVLWWVLMGCDPTAWRPSPLEAAGMGVATSYAKNRNMVLRWEALETALQQVAETGGNMQRYWQLWDRGDWWWHVNRHNITFGGHHRNRCSE